MCGSPRLIAACHVLLRLFAPRHPPYALSSLTIKLTQESANSSQSTVSRKPTFNQLAATDPGGATRSYYYLTNHLRPLPKTASLRSRFVTATAGNQPGFSGSGDTF